MDGETLFKIFIAFILIIFALADTAKVFAENNWPIIISGGLPLAAYFSLAACAATILVIVWAFFWLD
jgi:hypothetical protein